MKFLKYQQKLLSSLNLELWKVSVKMVSFASGELFWYINSWSKMNHTCIYYHSHSSLKQMYRGKVTMNLCYKEDKDYDAHMHFTFLSLADCRALQLFICCQNMGNLLFFGHKTHQVHSAFRCSMATMARLWLVPFCSVHFASLPFSLT